MVEVVCETIGVIAYLAVLAAALRLVGWYLHYIIRGNLDPKWKKQVDADMNTNDLGSHF